MKFLLVVTIVLIQLLSGNAIHAQSRFSVETFAPQGLVKNPRQVSVRFSQDMIGIGDPREKEKVFSSNCESLGSARWLDSRNWVFEFQKELEGGEKCEFVLNPSLRSLAGGKSSGDTEFSFSTGGINVRYTAPSGYDALTEDPILLLAVDGAVDSKTVEPNVYFLVDGISDPIGVRLVTGSSKEEVKKAARWEKNDSDRIVAISPRTAFPWGSSVKLVWSKNVLSVKGVKNDKDQVLNFTVKPKFTATFSCERENAKKHCIPLSDMVLEFSNPVPRKYLNGIRLESSDGKSYPPTLHRHSEGDNTFGQVTFRGPFPEKANFQIHLPSGLQDDLDRFLANQSSFPLTVQTDAYPPLAKFASKFGILEAKAQPILPVTVRHIEAKTKGKLLALTPGEIQPQNLAQWLGAVYKRENDEPVFKGSVPNLRTLELPKTLPDGTTEVVGIPLIKPGLYVLELQSRILGQSLLDANKDYYVPAVALVTDLSVHFKWGRESSLVWVTELSTGKPVEGADIVISDCKGKVYARGKTFKDGVFRYPRTLDRNEVANCDWSTYGGGLFVIATTGSDTGFVHSSWSQGIESWRYNLPYAQYPNERIVHTVLDRTLFRAGETVSMKHFIRRHSTKGFVAPDLKSTPNFLIIRHEGTEEMIAQKLQWVYPGTALSQWKIPKSAKLGHYTLYLAESAEDHWGGQFLGQFRVEEFRLPVLRASVSSPKSIWVDEPKVPVSLQASYLAGGAASNLPVKLRYRIVGDSFQPEGWEGYSFSSAPVKTGRTKYEEVQEEAEVDKYKTLDLTLDKNGFSQEKLEWKDRTKVSKLHAEMEFMDPNGEIQSVSGRFTLLPSTQLVGINRDSYSMNPESIAVRSVVVDPFGKPQRDVEVEIHAFSTSSYSHRKKLVGGFYSYESYTETKSLGQVCAGKTSTAGIFLCKPEKFTHTGSVTFEARAKAKDGKISYAQTDGWIYGKGDWWYSGSDNDRMDILADKQNYNPGEKAKIHIQAPFSEYTALINVEREGIMKTYVRTVDGKNPFVEIPIEKEFAPNAFVSVLAVRGRVGEPKPTAMVDLARPAFRLGITEIQVGWAPYTLDVAIETDKKEYQVRSPAKIKIRVKTPEGKPAVGGEVALAVVDESLLELSGNPSWDLLSAMMGRRGMEVNTYSAQMQVIGKRHFGRKAIPAGGGGGMQPTRELFDTLLVWEGKVTLDGKGEAEVAVSTKDSLTSYKVVAVATAGVGGFGTGYAKFVSTQDVLLFSGLPPVVRTGDRFFQAYNLQNNTKASKNLVLALSAEGVNGKESFGEQTITLQPQESKKVGWDVLVGSRSGKRVSTLRVREGAKEMDNLKITQEIHSAVPIRATQGTLFQQEDPKSIEISLPKDSLPGKGLVEVSFSNTIIGSTDSIKAYMARYPYTCMEQKVSKAVVSESKSERDSVLQDLLGHLDSDGLVKYFPSSTWGDEILTAYILSIAHEAGWSIPASTLDLMVGGLERYLDGTLVRTKQYRFLDSHIRRLQIMEALSRYGKLSDQRLSSTPVDVKLIPTASVLDLISILKRMPKNPEKNNLLKEAETNLRARLDIQGREMNIADSHGNLWWLMGSADQDFARLLSYAVDTPSYQTDLGRLAVGFTGRMKDGRFANTLANSYGFLALAKFSRTQEKERVLGNTIVQLSEMKRSVAWKGETREKSTQILPMNQSLEGKLEIEHQGSGKPWVSISSWAAVPLKKDWDNGIRVRKSIKAVERKSFGKWSVGDIVRVKIEWELSAPRTWVVVEDPVPSGATILGSGLGRDRQGSGDEIQNDYWASFQERTFVAFRSYYEYLPAGKYGLEYSFRLNQEGRFQLPPTRGEAMYSPDIFGETPNEDWVVLP